MTKWVSAKEQAAQAKLATARTPAEQQAAAQQLVNVRCRNQRKWTEKRRWSK